MPSRLKRLMPPRRVIRAAFAISLSVLGTYQLSRMGVLHGLERWALDVELTATSRQSSRVSVVMISDQEYEDPNFFAGRSPLDPGRLHDLVNAVARSKPAVIGLDIDTSHAQFRDFKIDPGWPPIVFEREASLPADETSEQVEPLDPLGGQRPLLISSSGIPVLLDDPDDKVTRLYTHCVATKAGILPTFVSVAAATYRSASRGNTSPAVVNCDDADSLTPYFIKFSKTGLRPVPAAQVMALSGAAQPDDQVAILPALTGKLVLIGGNFRDFDRHYTPIGRLPGVLLLANAIETELDGNLSAPPAKWLLFLVEFVAGALVVILFHRFSVSPRSALAIGIPSLLALSIVLSLATFHSFSRFASFAPTLFALLAFEIYEHVRVQAILHAYHRHGNKHSRNSKERANI